VGPSPTQQGQGNTPDLPVEDLEEDDGEEDGGTPDGTGKKKVRFSLLPLRLYDSSIHTPPLSTGRSTSRQGLGALRRRVTPPLYPFSFLPAFRRPQLLESTSGATAMWCRDTPTDPVFFSPFVFPLFSFFPSRPSPLSSLNFLLPSSIQAGNRTVAKCAYCGWKTDHPKVRASSRIQLS
jgi:hypothetical protein